MFSSRSFNLVVNAIIMSLCFNNNCLYLSTWALSCSIWVLSFSSSFNLSSYWLLIFFCSSSTAYRNCNVSSIFCPPTSSCEFIRRIFSSNLFFCSLSWKNSRDLCSKACIAISLSSSALFLSFSSFH